MNRSRDKIKFMVFIALYAALALVLDYVSALIPFLQMPQGGSINLAVIPVFVASYQLGWKGGAATGLVWWLVGWIMGLNSWYVSPMQYALDYIIPAAICGFASAMPRIGKLSNIYTGVAAMMILKFASHVLSGVYYWPPEGAARGSVPAWTYSLGYNLWYNLATMIVALILVPLLINRLRRIRKDFTGIKD